MEEAAKVGERIAAINPVIQVTVLDYFPAFRRRDLRRPSPREMIIVGEVLEERGLRTVIAQTSRGHTGPLDRDADVCSRLIITVLDEAFTWFYRG